jgi:hypothetical protein
MGNEAANEIKTKVTKKRLAKELSGAGREKIFQGHEDGRQDDQPRASPKHAQEENG